MRKLICQNRRKNHSQEKITEGFIFGGGFNIMDNVIDPVIDTIINPIVDPIVGIYESISSMAGVLLKIPDIAIWLVDLISWLVIDFLNPMVWINDLILGVFIAIKIVVIGIMDGIAGIVRKCVNLVFEPIINGLWGHPDYSSPTIELTSDNKKLKDKCSKGNRKCIQQDQNTIAVPVLFATIIMPPLGLFMEVGLKGWANVLVSALLTLLFYFPGLIYTLIVLYC